MKAKDLATLWSRPDNSRLTKKQVSVRLPTHVAARLFALEKLYPMRTRTELVGDLLDAALTDLYQGLPRRCGAGVMRHPDTDEVLYEELGDVAQFRALANRVYAELESEIGNSDAPKLFASDSYVMSKEEER